MTLPVLILLDLVFTILILVLTAAGILIFFPLSILSSYAWLALLWVEQRINNLGRRLLLINWWFISFLGFRPTPAVWAANE